MVPLVLEKTVENMSTETQTYTRNSPFISTMLVNYVMTDRDSEKETRHIELALDNGMDYTPGDAVGILPTNRDSEVEVVLKALGYRGDEHVPDFFKKETTLEDALRTAHNKSSSDEHPLLSEELLRIKAPLQREAAPRNPIVINEHEEEADPDVVDSFGTLRIARTGFTNYHAQSANSWVHLDSLTIICLLTALFSTFYRYFNLFTQYCIIFN